MCIRDRFPVDPPGRSRGPATHPHGQEPPHQPDQPGRLRPAPPSTPSPPPPRHSTPTAGTNPKPQSGDITRRLARLPRFAPLSIHPKTIVRNDSDTFIEFGEELDEGV